VTWNSLGEFEIPDNYFNSFYQSDEISEIGSFEAGQVIISAIRIKKR
jgi:hypothetical protein